jgi:uncharacterized protein YggE
MNVKNKANKKQAYFITALVLMVFVLGNLAVAAESGQTKDSLISVKGTSELYVPADLAHLNFSAVSYGKSPKEAENNGYKVGIKFKNILTKYGVQEKMLTLGKAQLQSFYQSESEGGKKMFSFSMDYGFTLKGFKVIDTLRQELVEAGASEFKISKLANSKMPQFEAKVRQLAYQNAKQQAQEILQTSGLKLGAPLYIEANPSRYKYGEDASEGLGSIATPDENMVKREPLFQQQQLHLKAELEVSFKVLE